MKKCGVCKRRKSERAFYRNRRNRDGLQSMCKACGRAYKRERGQRLNPQKKRAWNKVNYEIRMGRLERPTCCSRCGEEGRIEGHHPDYNQPLLVIWLCAPCHRQEHSNDRREAA